MFPSSYSLASKLPTPKYSDFSGYGWIIVTCSFILYFIVDGIAYNLGLVNSAWLAEFQQSETATSWIGSIFYSVPLLSAPITAHLIEIFGCKTITIICSIISTFGFVMSSFCGSIEQLYITVGLIAGFGASAAYVVGILCAERWFEKNRTLAIGIVSSGTGCGTFVIAPIAQRLLDAYGWRNVMFFIAGLNVMMGVVGCFIREPQWVIDEMEKKGIKIPKNNENHGIFEEHETSFGTFRRLSMEAIDDLKDIVRGHFSDNYSQLEEVVEENGQNFDKNEVMYQESETDAFLVSEVRSPSSCKSEVRSHENYQSEVMSSILQKSNVTSNKIQEAIIKTKNLQDEDPQNQKSGVMSLNTAKVSQTKIANSQNTPYRHDIDNIEQHVNVNYSQVRNNLENNINTIEAESNTSSSDKVIGNSSHVSPKEFENERLIVHLPQEDEENYQEDILESNGDYEALTSIITSKNTRLEGEHFDNSQCMSRNDSRSKFGSEGLPSGSKTDQVFTISGQNLENNPENVKICQHSGNSLDHNLRSRQSTPNIDQNNQNLDFDILSSKSDNNNLKIEQNGYKVYQNGVNYPTNITKAINNDQFSNADHQQPPSYSQSCYNFQELDTSHHNPTKEPQLSIIIFKFIKEKFKVIKKIFSHFSNRNFTLLAISTFAIYALYNIPIYFIIELLKNYGYTESQCANYISLIGISILVGMITLGYIGDVSGNHVKNVNALCVLVCGIAEILLPSCAENSIVFGICCVFFGFSFASAYVLIPKIAEMIVGVGEFPSAIGLNFFVQGLALLVGIPFASTIYEAIGSWKIAFEICGTILSLGSIFAYLVNVDRQ